MKADGIQVPEEFQFEKCEAKKANELEEVAAFVKRQPDDADFINKVEAAKAIDAARSISSWYFRIPANSDAALIECAGSDSTPCELFRCKDGKPTCIPSDCDYSRPECELADSTEYGRSEVMIAQYGAVVSLPAKTAGSTSSSSVSLDETTGTLKNFKVSSSPLLDKSTIEEAGKTAENAIDANDPLTKKKRELELRKTQNDISEEIKRAANLSNTNSSDNNSKP